MTPADVLRQAADYLATPGNWGRDFFIHPIDSCRCAAGAVAYVLDPADPDGDPTILRDYDKTDLGKATVAFLANHLIDHEDVSFSADPLGLLDDIEVIAQWNDQPDQSAEHVVTVLRAAADEWDERNTRRASA